MSNASEPFECAGCCVCLGRKNDSDVDTTMEEAFSKVRGFMEKEHVMLLLQMS